jgi:hypothetical protein
MLVELVQCKLVNLLEDLCDASGRSKGELVGVMISLLWSLWCR